VAAAFKIITADPNVKGILVNIFGGIMRCDVIAEGVIAGRQRNQSASAARRAPRRHERRSRQADHQCRAGLNVIAADDLDDAAQKIVNAVKGA
jgi:succinyl-CoA synthetase beta subunit